MANPDKDTLRFVPYEIHPEMVGTITAWLLTARDHDGVEPEYVSFNEPDVGAHVSIPPVEAIMLIEQAGHRFEEVGLETKWLIAYTSNINGSVGYVRSIVKNESIQPYLGVCANHSWDSDSSDKDYLEVRQFALQNDREVWSTETGSHAFSWRTPERFPTYTYAVELARIYSRVLKLTGTSAILYWEMMGADYWINDGSEPYLSFHVIRQLGEQISPGSVIVEISNNTEYFYSVVAQAPDHFVVFMVNTGEELLTVSMEGLPEGEYTHVQTTENELEVSTGKYEVPRGNVSLQITGMNIHILTTKAGP